MKKLILLFILLGFIQQGFAQKFIRETDKETGLVLLRGQITFEDIANETHHAWFMKNAKRYEPNLDVIDELAPLLKKYHIVVFLGTWCGDTKDLLPKFYTTIRECNFDMNGVQLFGVNRAKEAINIESKLFNITRVPTFIVMDQYREVGRITEMVDKSIEEDLLRIVSKDAANRN